MQYTERSFRNRGAEAVLSWHAVGRTVQVRVTPRPLTRRTSGNAAEKGREKSEQHPPQAVAAVRRTVALAHPVLAVAAAPDQALHPVPHPVALPVHLAVPGTEAEREAVAKVLMHPAGMIIKRKKGRKNGRGKGKEIGIETGTGIEKRTRRKAVILCQISRNPRDVLDLCPHVGNAESALQFPDLQKYILGT